MTFESSKSFQYFSQLEQSLFNGSVLDIGAGPDKVVPHAFGFDIEQGDANHPSRYIQEKFDCVYSSHCLEHMKNPEATLLDWWDLVKPGGYLFFIVPDEDLYEQGVFPSRFNGDHKFTFTIEKKRSWSPVSLNVLSLVSVLPQKEILRISLNDINYDRSLQKHGEFRTGPLTRFAVRQVQSLEKRNVNVVPPNFKTFLLKRSLVDQTRSTALAQIEVVLRKAN